MVERLREIDRKADPRTMGFLSDRTAEIFRADMAGVTDPQKRMRLQYHLGRELLDAGRTGEARDIFRNFETDLAAAGLRLEGPGRVELRMRRAVGMLRLGEQENCQEQHNGESCLFPLRPAAFDRLPRGSRGALTLLNKQLQPFPDDLSARWLLNLAHMTLGEYPGGVPPTWLIPPKAFESDYPMPRFTEIATSLGLDREDLAGGCVLDDFDNDGRIDAVSSSWGLRGQLRFFHHERDGRFQKHTVEAGLAGIVSGLNIQQTDYNNDGLPDIWMLRGGWLGQAGRIPNSLLRNNGNGTFTDVTEEAGLLSFHPTQTSVWFDYDGDGWLDFHLGTRNPDLMTLVPNRMFRNAGRKFLQDVTTATGTGHLQKGHAIAFVDLDHDGDQDLYADMGGAYPGDKARNTVFLNPGAGKGNRWLKLKLEGRQSNRAAIGARIKVTVETREGARQIWNTVNSGGSFGSSPLRQEIGLGAATRIDSVEVWWPATGKVHRFADLELDRAYRVREGEAEATAMALARVGFDLTQRTGAHHAHATPLPVHP